MTQEEKARRYDEVKNKLSRFIAQGVDPLITRADVQDFFPELAKSEDEKERKAIMALIEWSKSYSASGITIDDAKKMLAWLEKQGGYSIKWNKNTEDNKPQVNHSILMQTTHGVAEGEWQGEKWFQYRWSSRLKDSSVLYWAELSDIENQGEQKPEENKGNIGVNSSNWSEEDEIFVHGLIRGLTAKRDIHGHTTFSSDCIDITETINWLHSLQDRVQPQPKQEWSEEDEAVLDALIRKFEGEDIHVSPHLAVECLKSLKDRVQPQNKWKPSETDIMILEKVFNGKIDPKDFQVTLFNVLEQLKKLKGE